MTEDKSNLQTDQPDVPIEDNDPEPDFEPNPVEGEGPGDDDTGDMDLPENSFEADQDDDKSLPHTDPAEEVS